MMFGDFKVHIVENPGTVMNRIYLVRYDRDGSSFIKQDGTVTTVAEGAKVMTSELYFAEMSPDQLQALADALAQKGIKTNKDSVAEGKLLATERHLEDMRLIALDRYKKHV